MADSKSVSDIQELIDAVSSATWDTRNRLMEDRFRKAIEADPQAVPRFNPPGEKSST